MHGLEWLAVLNRIASANDTPLDELLDALAERWLKGATQAGPAWHRLTALGTALGLVHLADFSGLDRPARLMELSVIADFAYREFARLEG